MVTYNGQYLSAAYSIQYSSYDLMPLSLSLVGQWLYALLQCKSGSRYYAVISKFTYYGVYYGSNIFYSRLSSNSADKYQNYMSIFSQERFYYTDHLGTYRQCDYLDVLYIVNGYGNVSISKLYNLLYLYLNTFISIFNILLHYSYFNVNSF